jgi:hypothetical protein
MRTSDFTNNNLFVSYETVRQHLRISDGRMAAELENVGKEAVVSQLYVKGKS